VRDLRERRPPIARERCEPRLQLLETVTRTSHCLSVSEYVRFQLEATPLAAAVAGCDEPERDRCIALLVDPLSGDSRDDAGATGHVEQSIAAPKRNEHSLADAESLDALFRESGFARVRIADSCPGDEIDGPVQRHGRNQVPLVQLGRRTAQLPLPQIARHPRSSCDDPRGRGQASDPSQPCQASTSTHAR